MQHAILHAWINALKRTIPSLNPHAKALANPYDSYDIGDGYVLLFLFLKLMSVIPNQLLENQKIRKIRKFEKLYLLYSTVYQPSLHLQKCFLRLPIAWVTQMKRYLGQWQSLIKNA